MKRFIIRLSIFLLLLFLVLFLGMVLPDKSPFENLHYSIIDKHELLEKPSSQRIIFVGGSSLTFGLYSQLIHDTLNTDVINTAINAGYGLKFMLDDVREYIRPDDIIILIPEYSLFFGTAFYGEEALLQAVDAVPSNSRQLNFRQWIAIIKYIPNHSFGKWKAFRESFSGPKSISNETGVYERRSFNEFGDVTAHWGRPSVDYEDIEIAGKYNNKSIEYIVEFEHYIQTKDATLFVSFPTLVKTSLSLNREKIAEIESQYARHNLKVLGTPERYSFQDSLYFNTHYHLIKEGQYHRTLLLLEDLRKMKIENYLTHKN